MTSIDQPVDAAPSATTSFRAWLTRAAAGRLAVAVAVFLAATLGLIAAKGAHATLQATLNGFVTGSYLALAAVGLTFVYGILRLINFAQGDFLTFGAYIAFLFNVTIGLGIIPAAAIAAAFTALLAVGLEMGLWGPLRRRGAGSLELLLTTIGLAFIIRYAIQFVAGPDTQQLHVNDISFFRLPGGITIGRAILVSMLISYGLLLVVGVALRYSSVGKQMRAMADNLDLAETSGLNTRSLIILVWAFGGGLSGLAGVFYVSSTGGFDPNFGFTLLLPLFAAILLGGAGDPYGALAGGVVLGIAEEWSTLFISPSWKIVVGFCVLMLVLLLRPQGLFAPAARL